MKQSLLLLGILALCGQILCYGSYAPLIPGCWYLLPKAGIAPTIFTDRTAAQWVEPLRGFENTRDYDASNTDWPTSPPTGLNDLKDVIVDTGICFPEFKDAFTQRVLHIGGEIGYNLRDNCAAFIDFTYNRAHGDSVSFAIDRTDFGNPPSEGERSTITANFTQCFSTYHQFGAFLGGRYYFDRCLNDCLSFFIGNKVGIVHRNDICLNIEATYDDEALDAEQSSAQLTDSDNSVGGGIQLGIDLCACQWLSIYIGAEALAMGSLNTVQTIPVATDAKTINYITQPSAIIPGRIGALVQFPVWLGLRYNW